MIQQVTGDVTTPIGRGPKIIAHVTNDQGGWGRGVVMAISRKWREPERRYRTEHEQRVLGTNQYIQVEPEIWVANMCAQHGYSSRSRPALDYVCLTKCLGQLRSQALYLKASVHCPRIGCGLGGGDWNIVSAIIDESLDGVKVVVYDF